MALNSAQLIGTGLLDGFRNRIINGDMRIFQRAVAATADNDYSLDRWRYNVVSAGAASITQSTTVPTPSATVPAFTNSLFVDITTADTSIASTDNSLVAQRIEGFNIADLGWGTAGLRL